MDTTDYYDLPMLVGEQYMLTAVLRETRDTILYRGMQRDLRREVMVEALRKSAMDVSRKVRFFLDSAKAQAKFQGEHLTRVLEVLQINDTWMVVRENPSGDPLDMLQSDGRYISAVDICRLMILLCKLCLRLDAERVSSVRFHMEDIFYHAHDFCITNPARVGTRAATASRLYLTEAAREVETLLDTASLLASSLAIMLRRIASRKDDSPLTPALYLAEFSRLYTLMISRN